MSERFFAKRSNTTEIEQGGRLAPKFDQAGLIPAIVSDAVTGDVLMMAYMNDEALARTIETGEGYFWSRSRSTLWHKGATSGHILKIEDLRIDCDQDSIWMKVTVAGTGACCHTGFKSCFYRSIPTGSPPSGELFLTPRETVKLFDPDQVYGTKSGSNS